MPGPFLTAIDTRAAVKGSMDPLGQLSIWADFGRRVVTNLTTVANSARDFGVLLTGARLAEEVTNLTGIEQDLPTFLKWESLVAYSRSCSAREKGQRLSLRGIERVNRRLDDAKTVTVSAEKTDQILSNQKMYGLFGLFTVPARKSGLLEPSHFRLTREASDFVQRAYIDRLDETFGADRLVELLARPGFKFTPRGKDERLARDLAAAFPAALRQLEKDFFREWLLFARRADDQVVSPVQEELAQLLLETTTDAEFSFTLKSVARLAAEAGRRFKTSDLGQRLLDIATCESVIAPAAQLYSFALGRHGDALPDIAADVKSLWKHGLTSTVKPEAFERLRLDQVLDAKLGALWNECAETLHAGAWEDTLTLLLRVNAEVMRTRGNSAPWAELEHGKLKVRRSDEANALWKAEELPDLWLHPYFLQSLRTVATDVGGAR